MTSGSFNRCSQPLSLPPPPGFKALVAAFQSVLGDCKPYSITGSLPCIRDLQVGHLGLQTWLPCCACLHVQLLHPQQQVAQSDYPMKHIGIKPMYAAHCCTPR